MVEISTNYMSNSTTIESRLACRGLSCSRRNCEVVRNGTTGDSHGTDDNAFLVRYRHAARKRDKSLVGNLYIK